VLAGIVSAVVAIGRPIPKEKDTACIGLLLVVALAIPTWSELSGALRFLEKAPLRPWDRRTGRVVPEFAKVRTDKYDNHSGRP